MEGYKKSICLIWTKEELAVVSFLGIFHNFIFKLLHETCLNPEMSKAVPTNISSSHKIKLTL